MQKLIFSTGDILGEFFQRALMRGLTIDTIHKVVPIILQDNFQLIKNIIAIDGKRKCSYITLWIDDGVRDSDEWARPWDNFVGAIAENYIHEAMKL